ncbi:pilus assembly protein [Erythrobacter sp. SCSIO 43205]|uniref:TadE/TadG family type IV pilus assembly protein n=1 Tax=Erythrobacter sp. SCSIO 43205 TaxID=2779361 RepID=UPI001CAA3178|nr:TadE/TadG family type IV pilus assembly protein [Erythrobacter sp. SCSIO 43205]UAB77200.1 pilus assembly protein [Erythrobacter sp. SCSIO 43205]
MAIKTTQRLKRDTQGAALTEFALVAPVLILMIMGIFDMAHSSYTNSLMNGAIQKAARDLTLETGVVRQEDIDDRVINQVRNVVPATAKVELVKLSHFEFEDIGQEEEYTDTNGNGKCDGGEPYIDYNNNGQWDKDRGAEGIGGARDAVLYTVNVSYDRLLPMAYLAGLSDTINLSASTVLRNQPYAEQVVSVSQGNC